MYWINEPRIVEACRTLSVTAIQRDLKRARNKEPNVTGQIKFKHGDDFQWTIWDYQIEYVGEKTYLVVSFGGYDSCCEPNRILLTERMLTHGNRSYFVCGECNKNVSKLFLPQRKIVFSCRNCCLSKHELQTLNPNSQYDKYFYRMHRAVKLMDQRERVNQIFYNNRYSIRFKHFLKVCSRINGLESVIVNGEELIKVIKDKSI